MSADQGRRWSEWMGAAQGGDGRAYEALLREILPHVRDFIRTSIADEASAEDVAKTVLLSIHGARHSYRREQPFEPWLFAIVRKSVADFHRRRGRHPGPENPLREERGQRGETPESGKPTDSKEQKQCAPLLKGGKAAWSRALEAHGGKRAVWAGRSSLSASASSSAASNCTVEWGTRRSSQQMPGCFGGAQ